MSINNSKKEYKIIYDSVGAVTLAVEAMLEDGWELVGGAAPAIGGCAMQTLVRMNGGRAEEDFSGGMWE